MNIIEELYNGNIRPFADKVDSSDYYEEVITKLLDIENSLSSFLGSLPNATKEQELFLQLIDSQGELSSYSETQRFIRGFSLGARFMMDTFIVSQQND